MNRDEVIEAGARALATFWAASEKQPTDTDRAAASAAVNAVLPLITEAIAEAVDVDRDEVNRLGGLPRDVRIGLTRAARIVREWRLGND